MELERSTLADCVGGTSHLLEPLVEALRRHVMAAGKLHPDDTPVPVLAPGQGKTKTGRLWTYVRDDRPANDPSPPAVWFAYSPDHKGEHPKQHLRNFSGIRSQRIRYRSREKTHALGCKKAVGDSVPAGLVSARWGSLSNNRNSDGRASFA